MQAWQLEGEYPRKRPIAFDRKRRRMESFFVSSCALSMGLADELERRTNNEVIHMLADPADALSVSSTAFRPVYS